MATPPPLLARGKLDQTSLPEFLVYAHDKALDGTLVLQGASGEKSAILFARGAPAKARLGTNNVFLLDVIIDLGLVEKLACRRAQQKAEELGKTHGEVLRAEGLIDETGLYLALREQLARQVLQLCRLPGTTDFGFYAVNFLAKHGPEGEWRVKPLPLVWRALVDHTPAAKVQDFVTRLGERELHLRADAPVQRYRMNPEESALISVMRAKPQPIWALRDTGILPPEKIDRVITALLLSRQLDGVHDEHEPVGAHEPPESPASIPPSMMMHSRKSSLGPRFPSRPAVQPSNNPPEDDDHQQLREELERFDQAPPKDHYELLGVPKEADMATIRSAFFRGARRFHPDRLPANLEELRPVVTRLFARMGEAHQILTDNHRRSEYDKGLDAPPLDEEQEQVNAILNAASAYQRAEILLKKRDFVGALADAKIAYDGDPSQPDYIALYAWLEGTQRTSGLEDLLTLLDQAVEMNPANVKSLWYRGQLLKKLGKTMMAIRDFKRIVELKPSHVDAQRELRVFQMRKQTDPTAGRSTTQKPPESRRSTTTRPVKEPPKTGGLFGRLLKKD